MCAFGSPDQGYVDYTSGRLFDHIEIPKNSDAVIYVTQSPHYRTPEKHLSHLLQFNALNALTLAEKSKAAGAKRFIYFSSGSVYKPSYEKINEDSETKRDQWYIFSKLAAEEGLNILSEPGFPIHVLRPFTLFGHGQKNMMLPNLISAVQEGREIFIEEGETSGGLALSLTPLNDILSPIRQLAQFGGPTLLNIASDQFASIEEIANEIALVLGKKPNFKKKNSARQGNFIADISRMKKSFSIQRFTPWQEALRSLLTAV